VPLETSKSRWLMLGAYPAFGLALGLADRLLGWVAQQLGVKSGVATAVSVNVLMSFAAVLLALLASRLVNVLLGAATMTLGFVTGLAVRYPAGIPDWSLAGILRSVPPILVAAMIGYAVLGSLAYFVGRACRGPNSSDGPLVG
jgi:hypothetical protein